MFFSVIVPLYNKADVILRTLQSVADQSFRDFELIVIDDGSTDSSYEIVRGYSRGVDFPVKLFKQKNAGVSAARNQGAAKASGRYLAMLDGDDVWSPFHLSDVYDVYEKYPDAKVISTAFKSVNKDYDWRKRYGNSRIVPFSIFDYPLGGYPICSDTVTIDREYFLQIGGYDTKYTYFEDRELYYRIAEDIGCFYANMRVSAYYYHDAVESAHTKGVRGFAECGFMQFAVERMKQKRASKKMCHCIVKFANAAIRGDIVRGRWKSIEDLACAYPGIIRQIPILHYVDWRKHKLIVRIYYSIEWALSHTFKCIRPICKIGRHQ